MASEKRLIDANAIVTLMCRACNNECCEEPCEPGECFIYDALANAPTVDAVEVVHGRWIHASNKPGVWIGMKCSLCGARIKYSEFINGNHKYCHKCGAKMDGGNEDG